MKPIPDDVLKLFYYTEESPSCLAWAVDIRCRNNVHIKKGTYLTHQNPDGYYCVNVKGPGYRIHRIIAKIHGLDIDEKQIDHIDGNRQNNKISNLRAVEVRSNARNQKVRSNSFSGVTGVNYEKTEKRWFARYIDENGKRAVKSFAVSKYGDQAFRLAVEYRMYIMNKLNELGAGYTDRHIGADRVKEIL